MARLKLAPRELREYIREYTGREVSTCMQCGLCTAVCPVAGFMDLHPAALIRRAMRGDLDLASTRSLWICVGCMTCVDKCPRDVAPGLVIEALRKLALKHGVEFKRYDELSIDEKTPTIQLVLYSQRNTW
jgi:heterodisulfide reductase subunit C